MNPSRTGILIVFGASPGQAQEATQLLRVPPNSNCCSPGATSVNPPSERGSATESVVAVVASRSRLYWPVAESK